MKWSIHPDAAVEKDPSTGRVTIHNAGHSSSFTPDEIRNLPDSDVETNPATGAVTIRHAKTNFFSHFSREHFAALFQDADKSEDEDSEKGSDEPLITDQGKSAEDIAAEQAANRDETNNLLGAPTKEEQAQKAPASPTFTSDTTVDTGADVPPQQ